MNSIRHDGDSLTNGSDRGILQYRDVPQGAATGGVEYRLGSRSTGKHTAGLAIRKLEKRVDGGTGGNSRSVKRCGHAGWHVAVAARIVLAANPPRDR
jgi:hypothetical protein